MKEATQYGVKARGRFASGGRSVADTRVLSHKRVVSVTVMFRDGTDPYFVCQLALEWRRGSEDGLPPSGGTPEIGFLSIYMFLRHQGPRHFREERTPTPVC